MSVAARILVVEAEFLIGLEIQQILEEGGAQQVQLFQNVLDATEDADLDVDVVLLEARLGAEEVLAFGKMIDERGIPVVMMTADRATAAAFAGEGVLEKPFTAERLLAVCQQPQPR
ncbi:response regulator [Devosia sp.]|uniref:response regulator n=1 Tax=Devosia sp. TaxID=1871048 RepID=UPI003A8E95D0